MRITINGRRSELALHRYIDPDKWDSKKGYAKGKNPFARQLNAYIDLLRSRVYSSQRELLEDGKQVTGVALRNRVQGSDEEQKTLIEVFEYHNKLMQEVVPSEYSPLTMKRFETTLDHVKAFLKYKYKTDDILLTQLNHEFITEFEHYFKTVRKCNHNTTIKYLKNVKKVVFLAVKNDWLRKDPFVGFSVKIKPVKRDFLSEEELSLLEKLILPVPRLDRIRDIFVFSCYTGYAYVDISKLSKENVARGIDGEYWIYLDRQKTSNKSNVPLLPKALEIIEKYSDDPECLAEEKLLPVKSNQNTNAYLKEVATLAGIKKNLTFHVARHTFATLMLTKGVTIESVAEMLGHKDIRTTQIYAKVVELKVSQEMIALRQRMSEETQKKSKTS